MARIPCLECCSNQIENSVNLKISHTELDIVIRDGKPVSVILPIREYEAMLERLEDLEDSVWLEKARRKPQSFRPFDHYLADQLKSRPSNSS